MTKCKTCGGTYQPIQADGTQYFHRCPPLSVAELDAAVQSGKVTLPAKETVADAIMLRTYERNNVRDENLPGVRPTDTGKMKAPGAGVLIVADPTPIVVVALP